MQAMMKRAIAKAALKKLQKTSVVVLEASGMGIMFCFCTRLYLYIQFELSISIKFIHFNEFTQQIINILKINL